MQYIYKYEDMLIVKSGHPLLHPQHCYNELALYPGSPPHVHVIIDIFVPVRITANSYGYKGNQLLCTHGGEPGYKANNELCALMTGTKRPPAVNVFSLTLTGRGGAWLHFPSSSLLCPDSKGGEVALTTPELLPLSSDMSS